MESILTQFKVLSDETRLRIIHLLYHQDLCVCEMTEILKIPQPKISKHIAKIRTAKLVTTNQNKQYIYYALNRNNTMFVSLLDTLFKEENTVLQKDFDILNNKPTFVCTK